MLNAEEIQLILDLLREKHGGGYADDPVVARLQAKLSMLLQIWQSVGFPEHSAGIVTPEDDQ
jgi:hypothetical protein